LTRITHGFLLGIQRTKPDATEFGLPLNSIPAPETVVIHKIRVLSASIRGKISFDLMDD
jgi:hypothetical protein